MKLPFAQVDAFAERPFTGNPAAVVQLEAWLPNSVLAAIAAENNLAETAFVVPAEDGEADYALRWFTPTTEVALCGHATLASGHVLLGDRALVRFATRASGVLEVCRGTQRGYALSLPALPTRPHALPALAAALGGPDPLATRWNERGYALLRYEDEHAVRALRPDMAAVMAAAPGDVVVVATTPGSATDIVSRVFVPGAGIPEDPVTGSAHAALAPYWAEVLGRPDFTACQASARGGELRCRLKSGRVVLEGDCVTVIEGTLIL